MPTGVSREAYFSYVNKQIPYKECELLVSVDIANTLDEHKHVDYPEPSERLKMYVTERCGEFKSRESEMSQKNGQWIQEVLRIATLNHSNYELLTWAKEVLYNNNQSDLCFKLTGFLVKFELDWKRFDNDYFLKAIKAQSKDSSDGRR